MTPPLSPFRLDGMHRLIPSRYSEPPAYSDGRDNSQGTVLSGIADSQKMLMDIALLDGASNERIRSERGGAVGISTYELVYGIPHAHIVNAAFSYTTDEGARFSDHTRGAWYAADEIETSISEVSWHRARHLGDMIVPGLPGDKPDVDVTTYDDWLADFRSGFHELQPAAAYRECLRPEPVPACYAPSQQLAKTLLRSGSNGVVYPSVRRADHFCIACFRPALVYNPRPESSLAITLTNIGDRYAISVAAVN